MTVEGQSKGIVKGNTKGNAKGNAKGKVGLVEWKYLKEVDKYDLVSSTQCLNKTLGDRYSAHVHEVYQSTTAQIGLSNSTGDQVNRRARLPVFLFLSAELLTMLVP